MLNRRRFLATAAALSAAASLRALRQTPPGLDGITTASMRGSIDATELGVRPGALDDQSKAFASMLQVGVGPRHCRCSCRPASTSSPT